MKRRDVSSRGWSPTLLPAPAAPPKSPLSTFTPRFNQLIDRDIEEGRGYTQEEVEESLGPCISIQCQDTARLESPPENFQNIAQTACPGTNGSKSFSIAHQRISLMQKPTRRLSCPLKDFEVDEEQAGACEPASNIDLDTMRWRQSTSPTRSMELNLDRLLKDQRSQISSPRLTAISLHPINKKTLSLPVRRRPPGSPIHAKQPCTPGPRAHTTHKIGGQNPETTFVPPLLDTKGEKGSCPGRTESSYCPPTSEKCENAKIEIDSPRRLLEDSDDFIDEFINRNPILCIDFNRDVMIQSCLGSGSAGVVYKASWRGEIVSAFRFCSLGLQVVLI